MIKIKKSNKKKKATFSRSIGCILWHLSLKKLQVVPKTNFKKQQNKKHFKIKFIEFDFIKFFLMLGDILNKL